VVDSYIDNYLGDWKDERGNRLNIQKVDEETALVSFYAASSGSPISRAWQWNEPSVDMEGKYFPREGPDLVVELWENEGFTLHLTFEAAYVLDTKKRNSLVPALSRFEEYDFLDQYYHFFEPLKHYTKSTE